MKKFTIIFVAAFAMSTATLAKGTGSGRSASHSHAVNGHVTKNGTYVQPHRATNPDGVKTNNWSYKGNVNPYTGQEGTKQ